MAPSRPTKMQKIGWVDMMQGTAGQNRKASTMQRFATPLECSSDNMALHSFLAIFERREEDSRDAESTVHLD